MVFLALTRSGYDAYRALARVDIPLWIGAGVLSGVELSALRLSGVNVSDFNYRIEPHEEEVISGAVETIKEHHPGMTVWVEA